MILINYEPWMVLAILPQILVVALAVLILVLDLMLKENIRKNLGWVTAFGLGLILVLSLIFSRPGRPTTINVGRDVGPGLAWVHLRHAGSVCSRDHCNVFN